MNGSLPRNGLEDLAVTMLTHSRVAAPAATRVFRNGSTVDLSSLPDKPLETTTDDERHLIASVIGAMTSWPGGRATLDASTGRSSTR